MIKLEKRPKYLNGLIWHAVTVTSAVAEPSQMGRQRQSGASADTGTINWFKSQIGFWNVFQHTCHCHVTWTSDPGSRVQTPDSRLGRHPEWSMGTSLAIYFTETKLTKPTKIFIRVGFGKSRANSPHSKQLIISYLLKAYKTEMFILKIFLLRRKSWY